MHGSLGLCECVSCNQATRVLGVGGAGLYSHVAACWGRGCLGSSHSFIYLSIHPAAHLPVHPVPHMATHLLSIAVSNC